MRTEDAIQVLVEKNFGERSQSCVAELHRNENSMQKTAGYLVASKGIE